MLVVREICEVYKSLSKAHLRFKPKALSDVPLNIFLYFQRIEHFISASPTATYIFGSPYVVSLCSVQCACPIPDAQQLPTISCRTFHGHQTRYQYTSDACRCCHMASDVTGLTSPPIGREPPYVGRPIFTDPGCMSRII